MLRAWACLGGLPPLPAHLAGIFGANKSREPGLAEEEDDRLHGGGRKRPRLGIRQIWDSVFACNFSAGRPWANDFPSLGQFLVCVCVLLGSWRGDNSYLVRGHTKHLAHSGDS